MAKAPTESEAQSLATLKEQENMKPVPSQEDADRIKLGDQVEADEKQPSGPASDAADEVEEANKAALTKAAGADAPSATYKTRASKA